MWTSAESSVERPVERSPGAFLKGISTSNGRDVRTEKSQIREIGVEQIWKYVKTDGGPSEHGPVDDCKGFPLPSKYMIYIYICLFTSMFAWKTAAV